MNGMSGTTGKLIAGVEHLHQSVQDILSTPIGSRVQRREYGSRLFELIDDPSHPDTVVEIYAAVAEALNRWEPRITVSKVKLVRAVPGVLEFILEGSSPNGDALIIEGIVV